MDEVFSLLIRKLERECQLAPKELDVVRSLPFNLRQYGPGSDILREGDRPSQSCLIVEGYVCRFKLVDDGSRQIMSFHFPGDMPDFQSLYLAHADHNVGTLTNASVAFIPHWALKELVTKHPGIAECLWRDALIDASIFREWIINIGRRPAYGRLAHLICEQAIRLKQIGLGDETGFPWFITQGNLADATGLSIVHVNRTLQQLRSEGLIGANNKTLKILAWDRLVAAGGFDSAYLHLR